MGLQEPRKLIALKVHPRTKDGGCSGRDLAPLQLYPTSGLGTGEVDVGNAQREGILKLLRKKPGIFSFREDKTLKISLVVAV